MEYFIANPPAGIYRGDVNVAYSFYHVLLDVHARFTSNYLKKKVVCPRFSLNVFGKRADRLSFEADEEKFRQKRDKYVNNWVNENRLRDFLNLSLEGIVLDNDIKSIKESQKSFLELANKNYLIIKENKYFLNGNKIYNENNLNEEVEKINFFPLNFKNRFIHLIENNARIPVEITKPTRYSVKNPLKGDNLGPLFVSATLWEAYSNEVDLFATGEKGLTRYGLLRFLVRMATDKKPLTKNIFCFNKISPEGGFENWDMRELTKNPYETDILRYALIKSHSLFNQKTELKKAELIGGRNFVNLIGNLGKFFSYNLGQLEPTKDFLVSDEKYKTNMKNFKFKNSINNLEIELKNTSKEINIWRNNGKDIKELKLIFNKYRNLLYKLKPFVPAIVSTSETRIKK